MSGYIAFPDNIALAEHAAQQWLQLLAARDDSKPFTVALSGGRTPKLLYKAVAKQMAEVSTAEIAGAVPIILQVGATTTDNAVELARHAASIGGIDAVASVAPEGRSLSAGGHGQAGAAR